MTPVKFPLGWCRRLVFRMGLGPGDFKGGGKEVLIKYDYLSQRRSLPTSCLARHSYFPVQHPRQPRVPARRGN